MSIFFPWIKLFGWLWSREGKSMQAVAFTLRRGICQCHNHAAHFCFILILKANWGNLQLGFLCRNGLNQNPPKIPWYVDFRLEYQINLLSWKYYCQYCQQRNFKNRKYFFVCCFSRSYWYTDRQSYLQYVLSHTIDLLCRNQGEFCHIFLENWDSWGDAVYFN